MTFIGAISPAKKPSCCARAVRCWLSKRIFILRLAADLIALRDHFGRVAHHHVDARHVLFHARIRIAIARAVSEMLSVPPPMAASTPSLMISCAAIAIACRPEEQNRLTVVAGHGHREPGQHRGHARDVHRPAARAAARSPEPHLRFRRDRARAFCAAHL